MSDIVEKLHEYARCAETQYEIEMCDEAVKEITRLREALDNALGWLDDEEHDKPLMSVDSIRAARAAIREGGKD